MKCKQLGLRVLSTAAIMSIVSSIAAPAFADVYYLGDLDSSKDGYTINVDADGKITVNGKIDEDKNVIIRGGTAADYAPAGTDDTDSSDAPTGQTIGESAPITQEAAEEQQPVVTDEPEEEADAPEEETEETPEEPEQKEETPAEDKPEGKTDEEQPKAEEKQEEPEQPDEESEEEEKAEGSVLATQEASTPVAPVNTEDSQSSTKRDAPDTKMEQDTPVYTPAAPTSSAVDKVITVINDWVNNTFKFTIENVNINNTNTSKAAMSIQGKGNTTIELDGNNVLKNDNYGNHAALEKNGNSDVTGTLTITDTDAIDGDNNKRGSLTVTSKSATGIGGNAGESGENITITGNAYVNASGNAVGIGGGKQSGYGNGQDGNNITISGNSYVVAKGYDRAIGGSAPGNGNGNYPTGGNAENIHITDTSTVYADGGIGGGNNWAYGVPKADTVLGGNSNILIDDESTVYAYRQNTSNAANDREGGNVIGGGYKGATTINILDNAKVKAWFTNRKSCGVGIGSYAGTGTITIGGNAIIGDGSDSIGASGGNISTTVTIQDNATVGELSDGSYIGSTTSSFASKQDGTADVTIKDNAFIKKVSQIGSSSNAINIRIFDNATIGEVGTIGSHYNSNSEITIGGSSRSGEAQDGTVTINVNHIGNDSAIGAGWSASSTVKLNGNVDLTVKSENGKYIDKNTGTAYTDEELKQMLVNAGATGSTITLVNGDGNVLRIIHTDDLCEPATDDDGNKIVIASTPSTCKTHGSQTFLCGYEKNHGATAASENASHTKELPLDPNNHEGGTEIKNAKPATCTENGYTGDVVCKGCGAVITPGTVIPATNHAHTHIINDKAPTCTDDGYTGDTVCDDCHETIATGTMIEKLNHNWDEGKVTTEPTCTEAGVRTYTCKNDPTHTYTEEIPAVGHAYGEWTVTTPATCTTAGVETRTCANDASHVETREIAATGHQHTHIEGAKDATETEDGYTGDTVCDDCGAVVSKGESIPAKGVPAEENTEKVSTPELWVLAPDRANQLFTVSQSGTVRTYTSPYNSGTLTGTMEILQYLQEQGVETIVFTTNQRTSRFAVADLLALVNEGDVFYLQHMDANDPVLLVIANDHSDLLNG